MFLPKVRLLHSNHSFRYSPQSLMSLKNPMFPMFLHSNHLRRRHHLSLKFLPYRLTRWFHWTRLYLRSL